MPPHPAPHSEASHGLTFVIIFVSVAGGLLAIFLALSICLLLRGKARKTASQPSSARFGHKLTTSDASAASLLHHTTHWNGTEDTYGPNDDRRTSSDHVHERNGSSDTVATVKPDQDGRSAAPPTDTAPLMSEVRHSPKRDLPPLTIPSDIPRLSSHHASPDSPDVSAPSPAPSDSSDSISIYSQASVRSTVFRTPLPPMVPQYTHVHVDEEEKNAAAPVRSDTVVIGKLLKARAKRNTNRISRSVSRIERMGSIRDAADAEAQEAFDADDGAEQQSSRLVGPRRWGRSKRKTGSPVVPMGSESGGSPPSSSRGLAGASSAASPPATLHNASWVDEQSFPPAATTLVAAASFKSAST
ncbi:hypothetical protein LshimejAT787_0409270 [Lyophyllum shimeji]|uniref:Uncharacterized protein n=1 Tax=Lyophyllum shimeji TaxID=47721 RepID=A0A9P3PM76_LYOSH|nr:hypothetical protein LshimejAT787_0409270 [Lyophyllum shimeji]